MPARSSFQTVILFAVAYFVFIGRYGVRVHDRVTRALLDAIDQEPKLRLVAGRTPNLQPAA